jgi:hypothetical protein
MIALDLRNIAPEFRSVGSDLAKLAPEFANISRE